MESMFIVVALVEIMIILVLMFFLVDLKKKYMILENSYDSLRTYKHDYSNALQAIGGYIELKDLNGLKLFYKDFVKELHKSSIADILSNKNINNPALYRTLKNKYCLANESNIEMNVNSYADLSKLSARSFDLNRIVGILMDNSIEAAKEADDRYINVIIRQSRNGIIIKIENTFDLKKDIDISKIYQKNYSTKKRNSGIGLWEVKRIIKKYNNFKLDTKIDGKLFIQELEIN